MFTGWKTIAFGLLLAVGVPALDYLGAVNWTALGLDPKWSAVIGVVIMGLRAMTSTPVGRRKLAIGLLLAGGLSLSACQSADIDRAKRDIEAACAIALPLAPSAGELAPWIVGGCGSAQAIAKLAADPGSLAWIMDLVAKARALRS